MKKGYTFLEKDKKGLYLEHYHNGRKFRVTLGETIEMPVPPDDKDDQWEHVHTFPTLKDAIIELVNCWGDAPPEDSVYIICECEYDLAARYNYGPVRMRVIRELSLAEIVEAKAFPKEWVKDGKDIILSMTLVAFTIRRGNDDTYVHAAVQNTWDGEELAELRGLSYGVTKSICEQLYDRWVGKDIALLEWLNQGKDE